MTLLQPPKYKINNHKNKYINILLQNKLPLLDLIVILVQEQCWIPLMQKEVTLLLITCLFSVLWDLAQSMSLCRAFYQCIHYL